MDETSFQCWDWPRKVFRYSGEKHYVTIPSSRGEGLTIIGGITTDGEFHYIIRSTTNKENVQDWFLHISAHVDLKDSVVLMDNHASHHSNDIKEYCNDEEIFRLFQPASSSEFNPVEKIWSIMKHKWR